MADFKEGDACGLYQIVRPLGAGGMGTVYQAFHRFTGVQVAIKYLKDVREDDPEGVKRQLREAEMIALIESPNIVAVLDLGFHKGMGFIVMELLTGTNLRRYMQSEGKLPLVDALYIAREIAIGLENAHHHSVVHRDVKPENVQVTAEHEIKLVDFGASRQYRRGQNSTDRMKILGTPHYMSPEHLRGEKLDGRADLFALGVILYETLANRHPFDPGGEPRTASEIGRMQMCCEPALLQPLAEPLPRGLEELILKLMAKNRDERFGDALDVAHRLEAFLRDAVAMGKTGKLVMRDVPGSGLRTKGGRGQVSASASAASDELVELRAVAASRPGERGGTVELHHKEVASTDVTLEVPRGDARSGDVTADIPKGQGTLKLIGALPSPSSGADAGRGVSEADWLEAARVSMFSSNGRAADGNSEAASTRSKETTAPSGGLAKPRRRRLRRRTAERATTGVGTTTVATAGQSPPTSYPRRVLVLGAALFVAVTATLAVGIGLSRRLGGERFEARSAPMLEALGMVAATLAPQASETEETTAAPKASPPAPVTTIEARKTSEASPPAPSTTTAVSAAPAPKRAAPRQKTAAPKAGRIF
jgi:serine/threonine protein kinase